MPGLDRGLVEHRLPTIPGKKPVKQNPRRFAPKVIDKIKEEIERLLKSKFIRTSRYAEWISNVVLFIKKNGKLKVCIDFRDLKTATPKDEYKCSNEKLVECKTRAIELLNTFDEVELEHISRNANTIANELAQIASGNKMSKGCLESLIHTENELICNLESLTINTSSHQDWRKELIEYLQNPNLKVKRKIRFQALNYVMLNNKLYKRGFGGILFKCLGNHESYIAIAEVHEGICGAHQAGEKIKWTLSRKVHYWPTIIGKWSYNWEGPFRVNQVYSKNAYVIKEVNSNAVSKVINGKYLKHFYERTEY
uniref:RNase H type-1 domain-containing protein n=1 Tax=Cajanus cajan TaxID=3821 RepID=A0A151RTS5_CAJCA|nr:hypothetical protein KK1_032449 [Cajanus cajan]